MGAARLLSVTSCPVSYLTIGRSIARGNQVSKEARPTSKPAGVIENRATTRDAKRAAAPGLLHASPWAPWVVRHRPQRKGFVLTPLPTAHVPTSLALPARHFKTPSRHPVQVPTLDPQYGSLRGLQGKDMAILSGQKVPGGSSRYPNVGERYAKRPGSHSGNPTLGTKRLPTGREPPESIRWPFQIRQMSPRQALPKRLRYPRPTR